MKTAVITGCVLLSLGLKANADTREEDNLDEAFLAFLSEWAEAEDALDNMIVLDTLLDRANPEATNTKRPPTNDKENSTSKEANHDH